MPAPAGSWSRRIWPFIGWIGIRAPSGMPSSALDQGPAATTTLSAAISDPSSSRTPVTRSFEMLTPRTAAPRRSSPPARGQCLRQRRGQLARVDRVIVGDLERETQRGRERRLEPPRLAREQPVDGQAERLAEREFACERLRLVPVARGEQRAAPQIARVHARGLGQLGDELGVPLDALEPEPHQRQLGRERLRDRRQHPRGDGGRARPRTLAAVDHGHAQAALSGAPPDGKPNGAGAYNDDIG